MSTIAYDAMASLGLNDSPNELRLSVTNTVVHDKRHYKWIFFIEIISIFKKLYVPSK